MPDLNLITGSGEAIDAESRAVSVRCTGAVLCGAIRKGIVVIFAKSNLCLPTETRPHSNSAGICEWECGLASDESSEIL